MRRCLLLVVLLRCQGAPVCPEVACEDYMREARWTGRVAVILNGFIRTAVENMPKLKEIKETNARAGTRVEFYYHIWYNESSACDVHALKLIQDFADGVSYEPSACAWSWGNHGFQNHWHSTYNAFRALHNVFGKDPRSDYGLILRTGTDVNYKSVPDLFRNFSDTFHHYAPRGNEFGAKNNFFMLGYANGFDRHALGTPSLMRVYSLYGTNDGYGCDSRFDSFAFQRMARFGVWVPPAFRDSVPPFAVTKAQKASSLPFRCAPLYTARQGAFRGSLYRPSDTIGCREHDPSHHAAAVSALDLELSHRRRLAIAPPKGFMKAEKAFCASHQFDQLNAPPLNLDSADTPPTILSHHRHHVTSSLVSASSSSLFFRDEHQQNNTFFLSSS